MSLDLLALIAFWLAGVVVLFIEIRRLGSTLGLAEYPLSKRILVMVGLQPSPANIRTWPLRLLVGATIVFLVVFPSGAARWFAGESVSPPPTVEMASTVYADGQFRIQTDSMGRVRGLLIVSVKEAGTWDRLCLRPGDLIVSVGGEPVTEASVAFRAVRWIGEPSRSDAVLVRQHDSEGRRLRSDEFCDDTQAPAQ